jgi:tetratricopeptide (TPR) repeat protein
MTHTEAPSPDSKDSESKLKLGLGKRLFFASLLILLALLPFSCAELVLRQYGYGGYPSVLKEVGSADGLTYIASSQEGVNTFFKAQLNASGSMEPQILTSPKDPNVVRIFCLGGSAMRGYPQPRGLACSAFYEAMLSDLWSDRKVEVINLGTTAIASFPLMYYTDELLAYEPDLVIVYSGNNEFYGAHGVASVHAFGQSTAAMRRSRALGATALVQWMSTQIGSGWVSTSDEDPDAANKTLMERVIADGNVAPDDPRRKQAAINLGNHVRYIIHKCQAAQVPVIVCTTPANERDLAPIGGDYRHSASSTSVTDVYAGYRAEDDAVTRLRALTRIESATPDLALLQYRLGQAYLDAGQTDRALEHFTRARDLDPMPWRSLSGACAAVREVAVDSEAILCDLETIFRAHSPHGAIGWELMDDHVHPSLAGQILIARSWVQAMASLPEPLRVSAEQAATLLDDLQYAKQLGANPFDDWAVSHRMRTLLQADFFAANNTPALEMFDQRCAAIRAALSPAEQKGLDYWVENLRQGLSRPITGIIAAIYMEQQRYGEAQQMLKIARRNVERYSLWNLQLSWRAIVCGLQLNGQTSGVERELAREMIHDGLTAARAANGIGPDMHQYLGLAYHVLGKYREAAPHLQLGLPYADKTGSPICLQTLADCLMKLKRWSDLEKVLQLKPKHPKLEQARQRIIRELSQKRE